MRELRGVRYVNDSKATNVEATLQALASFDAAAARDPGRLAQGRRLRAARRAARAQRQRRLPDRRGGARAAARASRAPTSSCVDSGTLARAVGIAASVAAEGDVVLLSPACASYDQFRDYEARGERFRELVEALA